MGVMVYLEEERLFGFGYNQYTIVPDIDNQQIINSFPELIIIVGEK